jgi:hypothetical protein
MTEINVQIMDYDDADMLDVLVSDNAGQLHPRGTDMVQVVGAILIEIAYDELVKAGELTASGNPKPERNQTLEAIMSGQGIGNPAIAGHRSVKSQISAEHIKVALATIKSSPLHLRSAKTPTATTADLDAFLKHAALC